MQTRLASLVIVAFFGCATPPKPPELDALEKLRAEPGAHAAAKRSPDLINSADRWLSKAREEWQDSELEDAAHSAIMGQIKLKQALAIAEQDRAKRRIATAENDLIRAEDEHERMQRDLASLKEQIALLKKLQDATASQSKLNEELRVKERAIETERLKATAMEKISDAELALKTADTVNAKKHAVAYYQSATDMLARAQQELQGNQLQAASTSADMAKKKADEAADAAKPLFNQEAENAESRQRAEALARDAAAIAGIDVKRDAKGSLQRLVLPIPADSLFNVARRETTIGAGKGTVLDSIAGLIKKYASYPVQVIGYTDSRGSTGTLLAMSLARAQAVYSALVIRGVDAKRIVVTGQGSADPISDNRTAPGRARNNRVEIVFLYQ